MESLPEQAEKDKGETIEQVPERVSETSSAPVQETPAEAPQPDGEVGDSAGADTTEEADDYPESFGERPELDLMRQLLGVAYLHKKFYVWMRRERGVPHRTALCYTREIYLLFSKRKDIENLILGKRFEDAADRILAYIKTKGDYVTRFAVRSYCLYLEKKHKDRDYKQLYEFVLEGLRGFNFPKKRSKSVIGTEKIREMISTIQSHLPSMNRFHLNKRFEPNRNRYILILKILYETGARIGAIMKLKTNDVVFEKDRYWLVLHEKRGQIYKRPLSIALTNDLKAYVDTLTPLAKVFPIPYTTMYEFICRMNVKYHFFDGKFNFHAIRRGRAVELYELTKNIMLVKSYLGHKNVNTTQIYIESLGKDFEKLIDDVKWV